ncbi:MAG: class I SAM-dependent methyltransferase [Methanosarcina sp.]|nr:hypothetical protein BGV40_16485 [Methanosarcina sp. Ant1]
MKGNNQFLREDISQSAYLELLSHLGATRHLGGMKATKEMIELCRIEKGKLILDVGCGTGKTSCYITKKYGCSVVGVDISEKMISWSKKRAIREGIEDKIEFRVSDAQNLPFEDRVFDAVISESVLVFVENPRQAVSEYVRVTKVEGYIGLNEAILIKTPPPAEVVEYLSSSFFGAKIETSVAWKKLLAESGLKDLVVRTYRLTVLSDAFNRIRWFGFRDILLTWSRLLSMYLSDSASRREIKKMLLLIQNAPKNIYEFWGYGIYIGRK